MAEEMVICTRTFDFLSWLLPITNHFPRAHLLTFPRRLLDAAFDLRERLEEANQRRANARLERLERADEALACVRVYLRLAASWEWLTSGQYRHVAEMLTEITKAQLLCLQLGRLKDSDTMTSDQVSLAKRNNVSMAAECARETRRLLGANGILAEYQAMRHMANLESVYTYEGTHDVHTLVLGQAITGLDAFRG